MTNTESIDTILENMKSTTVDVDIMNREPQNNNNSSTINPKGLKFSLEIQAAQTIWIIWTPCILLLGGFGNVATVFVMRRIKDHNSSQHVILMVLAVCDFGSLYIGALRQWLYFLFDVDVYDLHTVVCKLSWWSLYGTCTASSWLLTCVTVLRTMAVTWPHKVRMVCTTQRTWTVIAALVFLAFAVNSHFVFGMELSRDKICNYRSVSYGEFVTTVWAWVDLFMFSLLPTVCLLICDAILSLTLFKATSAVTGQNISTGNSSAISTARKKTASKTTVMILTLSGTFLLLTMPVSVYLIWSQNAVGEGSGNSTLWSSEGLPFAMAMLLWYTNCAINFLLYTFTGTRFRQEFLSWIRCVGRGHSKAKPAAFGEMAGGTVSVKTGKQ